MNTWANSDQWYVELMSQDNRPFSENVFDTLIKIATIMWAVDSDTPVSENSISKKEES